MKGDFCGLSPFSTDLSPRKWVFCYTRYERFLLPVTGAIFRPGARRNEHGPATGRSAQESAIEPVGSSRGRLEIVSGLCYGAFKRPHLPAGSSVP